MKNVWKNSEASFVKGLSALWIVFTVCFFHWWLQWAHVGTLTGFILTSICLAWAMLVPGYCLFFVQKMKTPKKSLQPHSSYRVAIVVTKAPSEPLKVIQKTLLAAKAQTYPHDTWVADEDPTVEAMAWYKSHNIFVSCRKNDPDYHNYSWPRRTKCKEGNLAYFYDHFGYSKYDLVTQLDADHVPSPNYLDKMIAPFSDPLVGYVAAPSICDTNANTSWAARARLNSEAMFHGPIQSGSNAGWVPVCIGSHYTVRTKALKQIGGIGPELAEDYSTSLTMVANGWKGVLAYDAVAHGDGPNNFNDLIVQDYQWSRSLTTLLISFYRKHVRKLDFKKIIQFTFTQLWYPISAIVWLFSTLLPVAALLTGQSPVKVDILQFFVFAFWPQFVVFCMFLYVRSKKHLRPKKVKIYSWENALFELARWPWVLIACIDAVLVSLFKTKITFKVTSKDKNLVSSLTTKIVAPYFIVVILDLVAMNFGRLNPDMVGYFFFVSLSAISYILLIIFALSLHIKESIKKTKFFILKHSHIYLYAFLLFLIVTYKIFIFSVISVPALLGTDNILVTQQELNVQKVLSNLNLSYFEKANNPGDFTNSIR